LLGAIVAAHLFLAWNISLTPAREALMQLGVVPLQLTQFDFEPSPPARVVAPPLLEARALELAVEEPLKTPEVSIDPPNESPPTQSASAMFSAPVLAAEGMLTLEDYLRGLGRVANAECTVLLQVEVLENGNAGAVTIERGCDDASHDALATEYLRQLRWIPGRMGGEPRAMTIRHAVHFQDVSGIN
jgi:hypothetical protein